MDLSRRTSATELMDTENTDAADFAACLRDLATVNVVTLAHRATLAWLARVARSLPEGAALSVLDVGFGEGDLLRAIHRWGERRGLRLRLSGVDLNPLSTAAAIAATPAAMAVQYVTSDVFAYRPDPPPDVVVSSLFTHHLPDPAVVEFLRWMDRVAVRGWFINDLHRSAVSYHGFRLLSRAAGWHRFVQHDGPVSIARSFRRAEWRRLIEVAHVRAEVRWRLPFRYCVGHIR